MFIRGKSEQNVACKTWENAWFLGPSWGSDVLIAIPPQYKEQNIASPTGTVVPSMIYTRYDI